MNIPIPKPKFRKRDLSKMLTLLSLLVLFTAPIWASTMAYGTPITINNPTPSDGDNFGYAVSISGDKVLIGARSDNTGATSAGTAYLYDATTGALLHTFNNPTPASYDGFGAYVSISSDYVLSGSPWDDTGATDAGSVYLYDVTTGALLHTFNNPTPAFDDLFGSSVSISGDKVLIGARYDNTSAPKSGSAYLYDATTGSLLHTFNNPTPGNYDAFGSSVSLSGDKVLISAINDDTGALNAGSAYLYDATTGALLHTFNNPTPVSGAEFGYPVLMSGNKVLIGSYMNTGAIIGGSAYLFDATTGALIQTFNNPTPETTDNFGLSISISGDNILIGANGDNTNAIHAGSAYLYDATTGSLLHTFNNPTPASYDGFGNSVSISGDKVLIGAPYDGTGAANTGSAYLYLPFIDTDTDSDGIFDSIDNCPADTNADQTDTDADGQGNPCDFTPNGDTDGDGVDELIDNCAGVFNPVQEDLDSDGIGDACDPTPNGDPDPNPTSIDQCKQLDWMNFSFHNQGQCVAFVNTGHDSRQ